MLPACIVKSRGFRTGTGLGSPGPAHVGVRVREEPVAAVSFQRVLPSLPAGDRASNSTPREEGTAGRCLMRSAAELVVVFGADDLNAEIDTSVADVGDRSSDQLLDLLLVLATERAAQFR